MAVKQMTTQEIIRDCDETRSNNRDWKELYKNLHAAIESGKYRIMRSNNTLFLYKLVDKGSAQMFVFNADTPKNFLRNMKEFFKAMQKAGFHTIFGVTENPQILKMLDRTGYAVDVEDAGIDEKNRPLFKGIVHV